MAAQVILSIRNSGFHSAVARYAAAMDDKVSRMCWGKENPLAESSMRMLPIGQEEYDQLLKDIPMSSHLNRLCI